MIALNELMNHGMDQFSLERISKILNVNPSLLESYFPNKTEELLMDAVEYAGKSWMKQVIETCNAMKYAEEKFLYLVDEYALGTQKYAQSLSIYIDLWKLVKEGQSEYLRNRLNNIYSYYMSEFRSMIKALGYKEMSDFETDTFAFLMVILSDVIHVQSIILQRPLDYMSIKNVIHKMVDPFMRGRNNE